MGVTVHAPPDQPPVRALIDRRSYSVANDLQAATGTLADALRNIPGVEVDLNGNLTLRGGRPMIMIDGQPTALFSGQGRAQVLQSMPADRIDRVEVITNPTAEFSAQGQAGVINLVTKKNAPAGATGGLRANLGGRGQENAAANYAYVKNKLTVTADGGWRRMRQGLDSETTGTAEDPATGEADARTQHQVIDLLQDSWNAHLGVDYLLDPKTKLSVSGYYNTFTVGRDQDQDLLSTDPSGAPLAASAQAHRIDNWQNTAIGQASLRHEFPGQDHTLTLFFSHSQTHYRNDNAATDLITAPEPASSVFQDVFARTDTDVNEFKADYVRPMPAGAQLKTGYDLRLMNGFYNNFMDLGPDPSQAPLDAGDSNLFRYGQMVNAGYVTYQRPFGKWTVIGGLRVEDQQLTLGLITQGKTLRRNDAEVFPTLHLAYQATADGRWVLSYSPRIQRPAAFSLDPWRNLADPYNISMGNPDLKTQQTQSVEGGWQYQNRASSYLATLFYRQSEDGQTNLVTDLGGGVLLNQLENLSTSKAAGLELAAAAPLLKTLTYNLSTDLYWNQIRAPIQGGVMQTRQDLTASGHVNLNWQATKADFLQLFANVNAATQTASGHTDPLVFLSLGYRHKFTNNFALIATAQDPFEWVRVDSYLTTPTLNEHTALHANWRTAFVGFNWTFGGKGRPQRDQGIDFDNGGEGALASP